MRSLEFWKRIVSDHSDYLERILAALAGFDYCVVGDVAVNAYSAPVVTEEFEVVIATHDLQRAQRALADVPALVSKLRLLIQTEARYEPFVGRARIREVMDLQLPVAAPEDVLQGKVWMVQDETRRLSKRQKDLMNISRLIEEFPELQSRVPTDILALINS
ncbi:MAG TPA: hypothetical protein VJZ76_10915 [Thermoanaerobaculia bacterium]|nr:hypothetical protein [Thermoanaerobaculia bacterium]